jgi:hypothetical protein
MHYYKLKLLFCYSVGIQINLKEHCHEIFDSRVFFYHSIHPSALIYMG